MKVILDPVSLLFPNVANCPRAGRPLPAQLTLHSPCTAFTAALPRIVKFTLKRMNATVKAVKTCRFVWPRFQNKVSEFSDHFCGGKLACSETTERDKRGQ